MKRLTKELLQVGCNYCTLVGSWKQVSCCIELIVNSPCINSSNLIMNNDEHYLFFRILASVETHGHFQGK